MRLPALTVIAFLVPGAALALDPAFYVAPGGNDGNPGTLASPFATIARAQTAMRADPTKKTTYVRAGTYTYTASAASCYGNPFAIKLTSADNGEKLSYYPPDGHGSAFITGAGGTVDGGICLEGSDLTVVGLDIGHFRRFAIASTKPDNAILENTLHDTTLVASNGTLFLNGDVRGNRAAHNHVYNSSNNGIVAQPNAAGNLAGVVIRNNFVFNAATGCSDCGAIYTQDVSGSTAGVTIRNNYIRDIATNQGLPGSKGIYLDDGSSGHLVTKNIVELGPKGWGCFHLHGGQNNTLTGNICDQSSSSAPGGTVFYQTSGVPGGGTMAGNTFSGNIVVTATGSAGGGYTLDGSPANKLAVSGNDYYGYGSATPKSTGLGAAGGADSNPANIDPNFTCGWEYSLPAESPVFDPPTNFPDLPAGWGIAGFWGPPGFTIPRTGTPPSPPC